MMRRRRSERGCARLWAAVAAAAAGAAAWPRTYPPVGASATAAGAILDPSPSELVGDIREDAREDDSASLKAKYTFREIVRTEIQEDSLPELEAFLESVDLSHKLQDFYRKSVSETKYVFTLKEMDLRLMGLTPGEISAIQTRASELRVERTVTEERLHPLLARRNELTYGRLFVERSASSFEFYLAGFGPPVPVDEAPLVWADPRDACYPPMNSEATGAIVLAERGTCSFVEKANNVASAGSLALVVINIAEASEELFRVAATLGGRSGGEPEPKGPERMATVMVRGSTLPSLSKALDWGPVTARLIPLDCKPGRAACEAVLPEERAAENQVESGTLAVFDPSHEGGDAGTSFEFLSATFGATLPRGRVAVVMSQPEDACSTLSEDTVREITGSHADGGAAVLIRRGGCSFGVKAEILQNAGARIMVVQDVGLGALQNVGAPDPLVRSLFIPGAFITERAGDALAATLSANDDDGLEGWSGVRPSVEFRPDNHVAKAWAGLGSTRWPEEALDARVLAKQLKMKHADSQCRYLWVADKLEEIEGKRAATATVDPSNEAFDEPTIGSDARRDVARRRAQADLAKTGSVKEL